MDRGEVVALHQVLADDDRILEVVAHPRHEGDEHVPPERELAILGRGAVRDHLAGLNPLALFDDGHLVEAGILVGPLVLFKAVEVRLEPAVGRVVFGRVGADDDGVRGSLLDGAGRARRNDYAGIPGHARFDARSHVGRLGLYQRYRLPLHVGAHERAVGVVVLQEGDQGGGDRNQLARRDVYEFHLLGFDQEEFAAPAGVHVLGRKSAAPVDRRLGLRDSVLVLLARVDVYDLVRNAAVLNPPVRGLDEAELVDAGIGGEAGDKADIRALGRLDGAHPAVVRVVDVADLEVGPLAGEAAGPEGGQAPLVGELGQRVYLVQELAQLARAEELLHRAHERLRVY